MTPIQQQLLRCWQLQQPAVAAAAGRRRNLCRRQHTLYMCGLYDGHGTTNGDDTTCCSPQPLLAYANAPPAARDSMHMQMPGKAACSGTCRQSCTSVYTNTVSGASLLDNYRQPHSASMPASGSEIRLCSKCGCSCWAINALYAAQPEHVLQQPHTCHTMHTPHACLDFKRLLGTPVRRL